ncbi:ferric reductase-like transmembrane domain-containing protein [Avibacterium endocarditidis]
MKSARFLLHFTAGAPFIWLGHELIINQGQYFGADPIKELIHFLGWMALSLFLGVFLFREAIGLFKWHKLKTYHPILGLWAMVWASLHIIAYFYLELGLDTSLFIKELLLRPYLLLGAFAFVIFIFTSVIMLPAIKRYLQRTVFPLHQLTYIALFFAAMHYVWSSKSFQLGAWIYLLTAILLLILKVWKYLKSHKR